MPQSTIITSPKYGDFRVLFDDEDAAIVAAYSWYPKHFRGEFYAYTTVGNRATGRKDIALHRLICGAPKGVQVDHINHDTLDNRRSNLRIVTKDQNNHNSKPRRGALSKYKGVAFIDRPGATKPWRAKIHTSGRYIHLGVYATEEEAARAYDSAARKFFGEFAWLNFPSSLSASASESAALRRDASDV